MNKDMYLREIGRYLVGFSESEKAEILNDYEEHFSAGLAKGKSEQQICDDLGEPEKNARQYRMMRESEVSASPEAPPIQIESKKTDDAAAPRAAWQLPVGILLMIFGILLLFSALVAAAAGAIASIDWTLTVLFYGLSVAAALFSLGMICILGAVMLLKNRKDR